MVDPNKHDEEANQPKVEVLLSRNEYRLGSTVVGAIRLLPNTKETEPRSCFQSVKVCGVGRCRIDPRWHNPETYTRLYGDHPYLKDSQFQEESNEVVVWATNSVDIMELEERKVGKWQDVKPKRLLLPPENEDEYFQEDLYTPYETIKESECLEKRQMLATFRADLPLDIPPTASVTCCRYNYSIIVTGITADSKKIFLDVPFILLTPLGPTPPPPESRARVKYGTCSVMLHSSGLPCHVSADEIHAPRGQTTINRHNMLTSKPWDSKTLRVADPQGRPCCILTALGTSVMSPGATLVLQFNFPLQSWVPCYQISACLEGKEVAIHENGAKKARSHLFDTAHDFVEQGCTESLVLKLQLPLDCPITMETDLTKIETSCRIDVAIDGLRPGTFTNLRLDLPVRVVHSVTSDEMDQEDDDPITPIDELIVGDETVVESNSSRSTSFETKDILKELKILSLLLVDQCDLM